MQLSTPWTPWWIATARKRVCADPHCKTCAQIIPTPKRAEPAQAPQPAQTAIAPPATQTPAMRGPRLKGGERGRRDGICKGCGDACRVSYIGKYQGNCPTCQKRLQQADERARLREVTGRAGAYVPPVSRVERRCADCGEVKPCSTSKTLAYGLCVKCARRAYKEAARAKARQAKAKATA